MKLLLEKQRQRYNSASCVVEEEAKVWSCTLRVYRTEDLRHAKGVVVLARTPHRVHSQEYRGHELLISTGQPALEEVLHSWLYPF